MLWTSNSVCKAKFLLQPLLPNKIFAYLLLWLSGSWNSVRGGRAIAFTFAKWWGSERGLYVWNALQSGGDRPEGQEERAEAQSNKWPRDSRWELGWKQRKLETKIQVSQWQIKSLERCEGWEVRSGLKQGNERTERSLWLCSVKSFAFYPVSLNSCGESNSDAENLKITCIFTRNSYWF